MKESWNQRYATQEYFYGKEPNAYFKQELKSIKAGKILFPMEGEGRNAVYAAQLGWEVFSYDFSETGRIKAFQLAEELNAKIDYQVCDNDLYYAKPHTFDALVLIFTHLPSAQRNKVFSKWFSCLKPNAEIIMEVYSKEQLEYGTGGPPNLDLLYSVEELEHLFSGMRSLSVTKHIVEINEGKGHNGKSSIIRLRAKK